MLQRLTVFLSTRSGATAIEYGLIAALIGASLVFGGQLIGSTINNSLVETSEHLK